MTKDALRQDGNSKGTPAPRSQDPQAYIQSLEMTKIEHCIFLKVSTELINFWKYHHAQNKHFKFSTIYVRNNQPDGMAVAEIQSRYDLPEELPGLFGS